MVLIAATTSNGTSISIGVILPESLSTNKSRYEDGSIYMFDLGLMRIIEDVIRTSLTTKRLLLNLTVKFIYKKSTCTNFAAFSAFEVQQEVQVSAEILNSTMPC